MEQIGKKGGSRDLKKIIYRCRIRNKVIQLPNQMRDIFNVRYEDLQQIFLNG